MKKNVKIAQIVCTYPPYRGGMGNVAYEYTNRLRNRGYDVHVFTLGGEKKERLEMSERLERLEMGERKKEEKYIHRIPPFLHIGNAGVLPSLFTRLKGFDLIHLHYPFFGGAEPVIVRKAVQKHQGLIMTYHMDPIASGMKGLLFEAHKKMLFPWIVDRCDRILLSSQSYFEHCELKKFKHLFDRVEIHPFGIDTKRFSPIKKDFSFLINQNIPTNKTILLFVGSMDRAHDFKGISFLLSTISKTQKKNWYLILVGDGELRSFYEKMSNDLGLNDSVSFVGSVSDEDLPKWYASSDVHLFPSIRSSEAFGLVALEASACGIPSIASDLAGVNTVVLNGETGILVKPNDETELRNAIELLIQRTDLREQLGNSARKRAELFDWELSISKLEQTYQSVLDQTSKR